MILVVAEQRGGTLNRASWETIAAAQHIPGGVPIVVAVLGGSGGATTAAAQLAAAAVHEVVAVEHPSLEPYTADGFTAALQSLIGQLNPTSVLFPHTYQTRDFVPKLAARLDRALLTDVTGTKPSDDGALVFVRPMFQGKLTADVRPQGPAPHLVTFQIGSYRPDAAARGSSPAPVKTVAATLDGASVRQRPDQPYQEARQAVDLSQAERIVSVGRGIKGQEHLSVAQALADALKAELAASRPICDAGWLPMERQVGSSGQTVAPKLYVALGISGAIQHLVGMKGSNVIVAINKDPDAPIFEVADYGIVGDLFEVVPALVKALNE
ncbi:MAG: electron transfer flavoprotein subunit alpha/FixB family protein [Acidimicrobiia bacterium]|nr:electron transfer flavoprotein subunit alpha/FixB family protein [Acidimicrobiia bacterium]